MCVTFSWPLLARVVWLAYVEFEHQRLTLVQGRFQTVVSLAACRKFLEVLCQVATGAFTNEVSAGLRR